MFLERVSKFPRIINVGDIHIKAETRSDGSTISAECTATTFVLLDQLASAAPAGARPARPEQRP
jgi:Tfp pilus assembly protein PilO